MGKMPEAQNFLIPPRTIVEDQIDLLVATHVNILCNSVGVSRRTTYVIQHMNIAILQKTN